MTVSRLKAHSRTLAFISDIHGHAEALEQVLAELAEQPDIGAIVAAGDHFLGGPEPMRVWQQLQSAKVQCVQGLSDQALAGVDVSEVVVEDAAQAERLNAFVETRQALGELVLERIRRLPRQVRLPLVNGAEVLVVHGSPADPLQEMNHVMDDEELNALIGDDPADVVVCGASHIPFSRLIGEVMIAGVGSVGEAPEGALAHYTLLRPHADRNEVEHRYVTLR